jgi:hypothetical protein
MQIRFDSTLLFPDKSRIAWDGVMGWKYPGILPRVHYKNEKFQNFPMVFNPISKKGEEKSPPSQVGLFSSPFLAGGGTHHSHRIPVPAGEAAICRVSRCRQTAGTQPPS